MVVRGRIEGRDEVEERKVCREERLILAARCSPSAPRILSRKEDTTHQPQSGRLRETPCVCLRCNRRGVNDSGLNQSGESIEPMRRIRTNVPRNFAHSITGIDKKGPTFFPVRSSTLAAFSNAMQSSVTACSRAPSAAPPPFPGRGPRCSALSPSAIDFGRSCGGGLRPAEASAKDLASREKVESARMEKAMAWRHIRSACTGGSRPATNQGEEPFIEGGDLSIERESPFTEE